MGNKYLDNLGSHIVDLSESDDFISAKKEWELDYVSIAENTESCPCGQENIKELCYIKNTLNGNITFVGNVCVNKFVGIDTGNIFNGIKRIMRDTHANPNEDLIIYAEQKGLLYPNEFGFLLDTKNKRKLSHKQLEWKKKINKRLLTKLGINKKEDSNKNPNPFEKFDK